LFCVPSWQQFKYSFTVEIGLLNSISLANSHFHFLIILESVTPKTESRSVLYT